MQTVKCVIVGDGSVGKSCLLVSYAQNTFPENYVPTVFDILETMETFGGRAVTLSLWDTAGQCDYDRLRPLSYPGTNIFLLCFAIDCPDSYENVSQRWQPELRHHCPDTPIFLVGTKLDLRDDVATVETLRASQKAPITHQQGAAMGKRIGAARYFECSARNGNGMSAVFKEVVQVALNPRPVPNKSGRRGSRCGQM